MRKEKFQTPEVVVEVDGTKYPMVKSTSRKKHLIVATATTRVHTSSDVINIQTRTSPRRRKRVGQGKAKRACAATVNSPNMFKKPTSAWFILLLCLLARIIDAFPPQLQGIPAVVLDGVHCLPDALRSILRILNGGEHAIGKHANIRRPSVLEPIIPVGSYTPSCDPEDYVGGWIKIFYSKRKRRLWLPLCHKVVAIAPSTPTAVAKPIINSSPLVIPILCPSMVKLFSRPIIHLDGTAFLSVDEVQLAALEKLHPVIQLEIEAFFEWLMAKGRHIKKWKDSISKYCPSTRDGRFTTILKVNVQTDIAAAGLALLECFLSFASEKMGWISSEEANHVLQDAWSAVLPETAPASVDDGGNNRHWASPQTFWSFLATYIGEHAVGLSADGAPVKRETVGVLHWLSDVSYLILPRRPLLQAYASWLEDRHVEIPVHNSKWETAMQKTIMDWGISVKTEGEDISWRFAFYRKGQAPAGLKEKLPCLAFPLAQLPSKVITALESVLGPALDSWNTGMGQGLEVSADG